MPKTPDLGTVIDLEDKVRRGDNQQELDRWVYQQHLRLIEKDPEAHRKFKSPLWRTWFRLQRAIKRLFIWLRNR